MTDRELEDRRKERWHLDGRAVRTFEDAVQFIEDVGFAMLFPAPKEAKAPLLLPTFLGAWVGAEEKLPTWQHAFADPRAREATELMIRLLRERAAFEANLFGETGFLVAASVFPFFYGLAGDRNPRQVSKPGVHSEYSPLARDAFEVIRKHGPISRFRLREELGGSVSNPALERALGELWSRLRITRVDYNPEQGASWDALYRWAPEQVREGMNTPVAAALSALISKYLHTVVAAEPAEVEEFFSYLVPRSRTREATNALLAARELDFVRVGSRTMIQLTPPRTVFTRQVG
ncbi:MAG: hypothetical protein AB7O65_14910 [Candidatus Korobacteraceae bacterium]